MPGTRKLGKTSDQRRAMLRQQVTDFLKTGKMETTVTRAKEIAPLAEKMITLGKKNTLATRRQALAFMTQEDVVTKVFKELAPQYAERNGGYTRIIKTGFRASDNAPMCFIELVDFDENMAKVAKKAKRTRRSSKKNAEATAEAPVTEAPATEAPTTEPAAE